MKLKRFVAPDTSKAMRLIKEAFGSDAVILSSHTVDEGVEVVAAIDYDETVIKQELLKTSAQLPEKTTSQLQRLSTSDDDNAIVQLKQEVQSLRAMVEHQLTGLSWQNISKRHPLQASLLKRLVQCGLEVGTAEEFVQNIDDDLSQEVAWEQVNQKIIDQCHVYPGDILDQGGRYVFLGPTGVGKTTTIAKLAARFVLSQGPSQLGLVTMDSFRIGAHEQLMIYGKILGVNINVANDNQDLSRVLHTLQDKKLVLIDTAGLSHRDPRLIKQVFSLNQQTEVIHKVLVLSATSHTHVLREVIDTYQRCGIKQCILTKLDETVNLLSSLAEIITHHMSLMYLSDGQRVPEDIMKTNKQQLLLKIMESASYCQQQLSDELIAGGLRKGVADYAQD